MAFRTQKISQMTPKGSDLEATDLIEVSTIESGSYVTRSITGQELIDAIPAPTGFVPETRTLTINGTTQDLSADRTFTVSTGITIGTTAITSGTVGRVLFEGTGNVVQESANLFWDNTNGRLGIGTSSPTKTLDSRNGFSLYSSGVSPNGYYLEATSSTTSDGTLNFQRVIGGTGNTRLTFQGLEINTNTNSGINQLLATSGQSWAILTNGSEKMRVLAGGNVLINTTTDAGFRLDVNGTARVVGNTLLDSGIIATSAGTTRLQSSLNFFTHNRLSSSGAFGFQIAFGTPKSFWRYDTGTGDTEIGGTGDNGSLKLYTNNNERMRVFGSTGNVLINTTTDAGFRLDVNGTARVSGNLTLTGGSLLMNNNNIYIARGTGGASDGMEIRALSSGTDAVKVTTSSVSISSSGGITYQASAQLAVDSTTRGFLPPRMTTTQKNAIATPATGLQVYDTTLNRPCFYDGTSWITL